MTEIEVWRVTSGELTMALFVDPAKITSASVDADFTDKLGTGAWIEREPTGYHTLTLSFVKDYRPQWRDVTPMIDVTSLDKPTRPEVLSASDNDEVVVPPKPDFLP